MIEHHRKHCVLHILPGESEQRLLDGRPVYEIPCAKANGFGNLITQAHVNDCVGPLVFINQDDWISVLVQFDELWLDPACDHVDIDIIAMQAVRFGIPVHFYDLKSNSFIERPLFKQDVKSIIDNLDERDQLRRKTFNSFPSFNFCPDYSASSPLWCDGMIPYEELYLPYPLMRRMSHWVEEFDANDHSYNPFTKERENEEWQVWHKWFIQEGRNIYQTLKALLGDRVHTSLSELK